MSSQFFNEGEIEAIYDEVWNRMSADPDCKAYREADHYNAPVIYAALSFLSHVLEFTEDPAEPHPHHLFERVAFYRRVIDQLKSKDEFAYYVAGDYTNCDDLVASWNDVQTILAPYITRLEEAILYGKIEDENELYLVMRNEFSDGFNWWIRWGTYHPEHACDPDQEVDWGWVPCITPLSANFRTKQEAIDYLWGDK